MKVAIFDAFNGAGGDMIVASLLNTSLAESDLQEVVRILKLDIDFEVIEVNVRGIAAKRVVVKERGGERKYREVVELVDKSPLDEKIKLDAKAIFKILAEAEASVHGVDVDSVIFHEVGSDDAIFDIVCSAVGIRRLIEDGYTFFANPIRLGSGFIEFSHGTYPVPAPATLEVLRSSRLEVIFDGEGELLTPTAAAIMSYYCKGTFRYPLRVGDVSYGAGSRESEVPNLLRLVLGEAAFHDSVAVVETTIDDVGGEFLGFAADRLMKADGVLDVTLVPAYGKKGRPCVIFKVITAMERSEEIAAELMRLTGSLGVRILPVYHRIVAERESEVVDVTIFGRKFPLRVKKSKPSFSHVKVEFDDVIRIADELSLPPLRVYREIMRVLEDADPDG